MTFQDFIPKKIRVRALLRAAVVVTERGYMCLRCGLRCRAGAQIESDEIVTGAPTIRRPMKAPPTPLKDGPRINREIRIPEVMLIDQEGTNRGVTPILEALQLADEAALDLVEIVPNANPPVCKILDYGKFRFLEQKKAAEARVNSPIRIWATSCSTG